MCKPTPTTVGKLSVNMEEDAIDGLEANAVRLVSSKTTIPVPRIRRVVKGEWDFLIVMDCIKATSVNFVVSRHPR